MYKFPVLEIFGPTIQGEGMVVGRKTMFVRTAGCDYSCSWCDSAFTWDGSSKEDIKQLTADEILCRLKKDGGKSFDYVTISGGNPALFSHLDELINLLHSENVKVALETQGSRWQEWFLKIDDLTLSPKPPSSQMITNWKILDEIIGHLSSNNRLQYTSLKIVIFTNEDLTYAKKIHERFPHIPLYLQVGNEDLDEDNEERLMKKLLEKYKWLVNEVMVSSTLNSVHVLPQLHTLLWGNRRGV
ncbi:7-carboxy-7-deazaguanine synthase QueE [Evansella cellulosilytica]|uniref:7-carboxy-7-deazaguanine synthase n=1 Tax=Evansella cellulosilytica (strain ATCC 21833 / DSM 2522 / FERM P-1141 / JCM 9156 / N-4) TaxID=649639 RepID=E6TRC0_EVAC2|nr:7-carboxy-7-deazaguanine synthase QueE [Evansella cellulosilytica]ADU30632.1 7-cyano-7-deazaguanosine (preQ0) biosynthesis protein QueE [Evansella cellulosilytica DSM 2522]